MNICGIARITSIVLPLVISFNLVSSAHSQANGAKTISSPSRTAAPSSPELSGLKVCGKEIYDPKLFVCIESPGASCTIPTVKLTQRPGSPKECGGVQQALKLSSDKTRPANGVYLAGLGSCPGRNTECKVDTAAAQIEPLYKEACFKETPGGSIVGTCREYQLVAIGLPDIQTCGPKKVKYDSRTHLCMCRDTDKQCVYMWSNMESIAPTPKKCLEFPDRPDAPYSGVVIIESGECENPNLACMARAAIYPWPPSQPWSPEVINACLQLAPEKGPGGIPVPPLEIEEPLKRGEGVCVKCEPNPLGY